MQSGFTFMVSFPVVWSSWGSLLYIPGIKVKKRTLLSFVIFYVKMQNPQCSLLFLACSLRFLGAWNRRKHNILYLIWDRKCSTVTPPSAPLAASISVFGDGSDDLYWTCTTLRFAPLVCIIRMSDYWHHTAKVCDRVTKSNFSSRTSCSCAHFGLDVNTVCGVISQPECCWIKS